MASAISGERRLGVNPEMRARVEAMHARIRERQEAGREHRERMYQRQLTQKREAARRRLRFGRAEADALLIRRANALRAARLAAEGDLAELVAQQERDERFGHRLPRQPWLVSLDERDRYGRERYETFEAA